MTIVHPVLWAEFHCLTVQKSLGIHTVHEVQSKARP